MRLGLVLLCRLREWLEPVLRPLQLLSGELDMGRAVESDLTSSDLSNMIYEVKITACGDDLP